MSSEASRPPEFPESTSHTSAKKIVEQSSDLSSESAGRPTLMGPPKRPAKPVAAKPPAEPVVKTADAATAKPTVTSSTHLSTPPASEATDPSADEAPKPRQQPISPPSEPMQYRAIGLLRGRYIASEEMFNRGQIITQDDTPIGAVLLGRVTSLVKKHLDMESNHLWVVYPRTNPEQGNALNVQIVGVWEPETLGSNDETDADAADAAEATEAAEATDKTDASDQAESSAAAEVTVSAIEALPEAEQQEASPLSTQKSDDGSKDSTEIPSSADLPTSDEIQSDYFSIRGEVAKYFEDRGAILINIMQKVKSGAKQQRPFKLLVNGHLEGKTIGYFWDLDVERKADQLVLRTATQIAAVPPKKKSAGGGRRGGPGGGHRKQFNRNSGPPRRTQDGGKPEGGGYRNTRPITKKVSSEVTPADQT